MAFADRTRVRYVKSWLRTVRLLGYLSNELGEHFAAMNGRAMSEAIQLRVFVDCVNVSLVSHKEMIEAHDARIAVLDAVLSEHMGLDLGAFSPCRTCGHVVPLGVPHFCAPPEALGDAQGP